MSLAFILFAAIYFCCAAAWFGLVQKPLFALLNIGCAPERPGPAEVRKVYARGTYSDCIIASYLTAIPLILAAVRAFIPSMDLGLWLGVYNAATAVAVGLITISDAVLYRYWQYKLDSSVFVYLRNPKGAFASVSTLYLIGAAIAAGLFCSLYYLLVSLPLRLCGGLMPSEPPGVAGGVLTPVLAILMLGGLFLVTRGLGIRPNNPSIAYFSPVPFLNHWALNPAFNLLYSLSTKDDYEGRFQSMPAEEAESLAASMFPTAGTPLRSILNTPRPNILLIVWESLGAEFVESLGGRKGVTPNLDRIASEGVVFTQCTAGSFRTDRGLVCLLGGIPGQPTTSLIRYTRKLAGLPALPRRLHELGYHTTAIHGGDLAIMHKADYYLASGHERLISQNELPKGLDKGKWGVHDGPVFEILSEQTEHLARQDRRWFATFQTLSSHEPFVVPYKRLDDPVENSFAYTDHALGRFMDRLKASEAWKDTLVIIVADHGYNISHLPVDRRAYAHIPLVMAGGAVKGPARIDTMMSQTDLAATLLGQMGLPHDEFRYSRDVLADTYTAPSAFHTFNNGFLFIDPTGATLYDNVAERAVKDADPERERKGKAILQTLYADLAKR